MKKQRVLYTWILEFAVLLMLMVFMCVTLTVSARQTLLEEYSSMTSQQQEKIESALNSKLDQIKSDAIDLAFSTTVRSFALLSNPAQADNYTLYTIRSLLAEPNSESEVVSETWLYFCNIEKAMTSQTIYERRDLVEALFGSENGAQQRLDELLQTSSLFRLVIYVVDGETRVLAVTGIPTQNRAPKALIIQQLDPSALCGVIEGQASWENATTLLTDSHGTLLCESGDEVLAAQVKADEVNEGTCLIGGDQYWLMQKELRVEGWLLTTLVPMSSILQKSSWVWQRSIGFLAVFLVVGIFAAISMVRRNYKPLNNIIRDLPKGQGSDTENEYARIGGAFREIREDLARLQLLQENQKTQIQREILQTSLEHDIDVLALSGMEADWLQAESLGRWFALFALKDEGLEFSELDVDGCSLIHVHPHGMATLCLFAYDEASLRAGCTQLKDYLEQNGISFTESTVQSDWQQMHPVFLALCEQEEMDHSPEGVQSVTGSSLVRRITVVRGNEIARLTFTGSGDEAVSELHHALKMNAGKMPDMFLVRMFLTDILVTLFNAVPDGSNGEEVQQAIVSTSRALQKAMTHTEAEEQMSVLLRAIAAKYVPAEEEPQSKLLDRTLECVHAHFREHDFNVSRAADLLNVSVAYLSKYFKQQTGINLLNYINSLRIDYAKKLMDEEHLTVAEAADRAGYESANTFIRLFKKYAGDTPGNYKKR